MFRMEEPKVDSSVSVRVRCRLQRFSDARCFSAWVVSFDEHSVVVEVAALEGLEVGDKFLFQISGMDACAMFEAELTKEEGAQLAFQVLSRIHVRPPYEDARIRTNLEGVVHMGDADFEIRVEDVSAGGIGFLAEQPLEPWTTVSVLVKTEYGDAQVEGEVRYCKPVEVGKWRHRIGLRAPGMKHSLPLFGIRCSKASEAA